MHVMRTGITTTFHGPTERLSARIIARFGNWRVSTDYNYALTSMANHLLAARALCAKFGLGWLDGGRVMSVWDSVHQCYVHCDVCLFEVSK